VKEIKLTQDKVAQVDDADYEWLSAWKWYAKWDGWHWYAMRNSPYDANGKQHTILMHRQILGAQPGEQVDHRNRKGLDNQRHNLRFCTYSQNQANRKKRAGCMSQYKGVHWDKRAGKWQARIRVHGKWIHLGLFDDEIAAALAYNKAATEYFGEFARPNTLRELSCKCTLTMQQNLYRKPQ